MECNKQVAIRAKNMAEKRMQSNDFVGAQKMARKAQQLFPELENLSQILTVCEVLCSAEVKVNGMMDWYGILQVQPTVDEPSIKKQYRTLSLVLDPKTNQFAGAEAALKLIGKAKMALLNRSIRSAYDIDRNATVKSNTEKQPSPQASNSRTNFSNVNFSMVQQQQQQQSSISAMLAVRPGCGDCRSIPNSCFKSFVACDLSVEASPTAVDLGQSNSRNTTAQTPISQTNSVNHENQSGSVPCSIGPGNVSGLSSINSIQKGGPAENRSSDAKVDLKGTSSYGVNFTNVDSAGLDQKKKSSKLSIANAELNRHRKVVIDLDSSISEAVPSEIQFDSTPALRRSSRKRGGDGDYTNPHRKKLRGGMTHTNNGRMAKKQKDSILHEQNPLNGTEKAKEDMKKGSKEGANMKGNSGLESGPSVAPGLENLSDRQATLIYPDPEFCDFDNFRNPTKFAPDQIWAVYDNVDGMPRFYARIRKIEGPGFRVKFTWLEYNPTNEAEIAWSDAEFPVACGNFRLGRTERSEDRLMFSHLFKSWAKGKTKNSYNVYPREGEVWALFKHWNISWNSDPDNHRLYEYEVVEVLSNFVEGTGITVVPLVKIEDFVSLFMRSKTVPFVIPPSDLLKFSHSVPCYRLVGSEREGIPHVCLELDCVSLPCNFSEVFPSVTLETLFGSANDSIYREKHVSHKKGEVHAGGSQGWHPDGTEVVDKTIHHPAARKNIRCQALEPEVHINGKHVENNIQNLGGSYQKDVDEIYNFSLMSSSPVNFAIPETEFHKFEEAKKIENFKCGQIWALYSDIDKYPKYYGYVRNVDIEKNKVLVTWLESCSQDDEEKRWLKDDMPVSCGNFKISRQSMMFGTDTFSHLAANQNGKAQFTIVPRVHEIWAVYKNWRVGWSHFDLKSSNYDVVEIFEDFGSGIKVNILTKVSGYRAVFRFVRDGKAVSTMTIPAGEYIRFSHRIPSFPLTNERGGKLMGCWELDPAAVPEHLLSE